MLALTLALFAASALLIAGTNIEGAALALPWAALALIAIADAATSPGARDVTLDGPTDVFAGEAARFTARLSASGDLPPAIDAQLEPDEGLGPAQAFSLTGRGAEAMGAVDIPARRRGVYPLRRLWLRWPSRLGLWEIVPRLPLERQLAVVPNIRPVSSGKIDVAVRSELYGIKENSAIGEGSEYHQMRDFQQGMDTRSIDWKRSARRRELVVKEMRAERNHQIILALDNGYLMREEIDGLPKIDHAVHAALATAWAAGIGGDLAGLYSFDAVPGRYIPPRPGRAAFPALRAHTADLRYQSVASNHTLALMNLGQRLERRSLIVMFSDFADTTTAELLVENLAVLGRHHVLIFATFRDPELEARVSRPAADLDMMAETVAAAAMHRERRLLLDRLGRMGILCIETAPGQLTSRVVAAYLKIKAEERV
ncbi:MAG: DUF58 domain-containing protein [Pseudomonadota bacterium]